MKVTDHNTFFDLKIEIRHVNAHWVHPKEADGFLKPLKNRDYYERETESWYERVMWLVENGNYSSIEEGSEAESHHLPVETEFMPEFEHPTHFQAYSVSSGGVPITPVLDSPMTVISYLSRKLILTISEQDELLKNIK